MRMRKIIRRFLNQEQRKKIWLFISRLNAAAKKTAGLFINMLPPIVKIFLKSNLNIVKKMDYDEGDILLDISSSMEYRVRLFSCKKEPETVKWIKDFFEKKDVFYDIGANIGAYSLVAAKHLDGQAAIYAFEPSFLNYFQLAKNIFINKYQDTITPLNIALSDKTVVDRFYYQNLIPGGALHSFGKAIDYKNESFTPVFAHPVLSYSIDDLVKKFNIPLPNHIKLDVDGIEMSILQGAQEALSSPQLKSILVETDEEDSIIDYLLKRGFRIFSRHSQGFMKKQMYNYIFSKT